MTKVKYSQYWESHPSQNDWLDIEDDDTDIRMYGDGGFSILDPINDGHYCRLSIKEWVKIRDFINNIIIDRQSGCDHLHRRQDPNWNGMQAPNFSCSNCGYET